MMNALKGEAPPTPTRRLDYRPPAWLIDTVVMNLRLDPERTVVNASLRVRRNPELAENSPDRDAPLELHGSGLDTRKVALDGQLLDARRWRIDDERMTIEGVPERACITTEVVIDPSANTALEGLYQSGSSLLTQCEPEGFRKITWFGDRPDIMSTYRVRLEADADRYPVLLGNGNLIESGELPQGWHFTIWDDPYPKPSYLFALVAGSLGCKQDRFETASGREVVLKIYSERDNLGRLDHAMDSLKKAMRWDEQRFGLEYDLDVYHIVATHDFNMGAMENKSLNIFNARYVLADPDTATDADYEAIEGVIAHEYFHNWTGNRVTCRDWFQLTLKEGLTVFRDQEFSADMQSAAVKRISDVRDLIARQWPEDAGPMAHPIRPERYIEINNFYTATVYEKGAEVVRMYQTLLGREGFRRGMDLYFQRHDGQAVSCDDFRNAMAEANQVDLEQFERWYRQVGTPGLVVETRFEPGQFRIRLRQSLPEHPDNAEIGPLHIPVMLGLLDRRGRSLALPLGDAPARETHRFELREAEAELVFSGLESEPVVSVLRGYSAPVKLEQEMAEADRALILAFDPDPVARWMAGRKLASGTLERAVRAADRNRPDPALLIDAWRQVLERADEDPALAAELLTLPSESELAQDYRPVPVEAIHAARKHLRGQLAAALEGEIERVLAAPPGDQGWRFTPEAVGRRRLLNALISLACAGDRPDAHTRAHHRYRSADNMTDRYAALAALVHHGADQADSALAEFERRYRDNPLVLDKWFALQAQVADPATVERVAALMEHPAFSLRNPNKTRALLGAFGVHNPIAFHRPDGAGYRLLGRVVRELDRLNPQVAARLVTAFNRLHDYDAERAELMRTELQGIQAIQGLSPDVAEIVSAALAPRD